MNHSESPITPEESGFVQDLEALALEAEAPRVSVAAIEKILAGRGFASLILLLALPFVQPIPVPGLSVPFGLVIIALGLRIALGRGAGLPHWLRRHSIDGETLTRLVSGARRVFARCERIFRRRLLRLLEPPLGNLAGVSIMTSGLALSLPLPPVILFSNSLPAIAVILLCLGLMERDGAFVAAGHVVAVATWIYLAFWWEIVTAAIRHFF